MVAPLQWGTFAAITGTMTSNIPATGILPSPARQVICTPKRFCFISLPSSWEGGDSSWSLETKLKGSKTKGEELSPFLQRLCHQIAWCKKLLPQLSHYVYLAGSQDMEQFSDSASEASFSTCTDCRGTGTTALPHCLSDRASNYCWQEILSQQRNVVCTTHIY